MAGVGSSVVASIQLSKGKLEAARLNVTQALLFVTIAAIVPSALMMAYPSATARFLGSSEHLTPMVREYLLWFIPSLIFQMWCSVRLFMIRLDGAPKLAMMCNIIAAIITVILGWLFIFPLGWGLMGAAFAATIGLFASGATGLIYLWKFAHKLR
ncbi:polysaccharide biosynthesis C-terminal domain-containing protein, partial [[Eubacterium] rectale]|nr:polysaccharide biosynthesis C-terminal domain-containing protein [Agathobacter rectalis]